MIIIFYFRLKKKNYNFSYIHSFVLSLLYYNPICVVIPTRVQTRVFNNTENPIYNSKNLFKKEKKRKEKVKIKIIKKYA